MKVLLLLFANLFRSDFIRYKHRFGLQEQIQIHHIIPLEWKRHKNLIKNGYNINGGYNLIFMPSTNGKKNIATIRRIHDGGHPEYNKYVYDLLQSETNPFEINKILRNKLINNEEIPW